MHFETGIRGIGEDEVNLGGDLREETEGVDFQDSARLVFPVALAKLRTDADSFAIRAHKLPTSPAKLVIMSHLARAMERLRAAHLLYPRREVEAVAQLGHARIDLETVAELLGED